MEGAVLGWKGRGGEYTLRAQAPVGEGMAVSRRGGRPPDVIPAKAGIQGNRRTPGQVGIPAYAGMTLSKSLKLNDATN
jgi:hypothetical protein